MTDTPMTDAWLASQQMMETFSGFSPDEIERMSMAQYAKLRQRAGLPPVEHPAAPLPAPPAPPEPVFTGTVTAPEPADFARFSMGEYAELRQQLGVGQGRQEGVGIFDSAGRQAQLNGVRAHAGPLSSWRPSFPRGAPTPGCLAHQLHGARCQGPSADLAPARGEAVAENSG